MRIPRTKRAEPRFAVCVDNTGYEADAAQDDDIRIIDESGADYLYSIARFVAINIPKRLGRSILKKAS